MRMKHITFRVKDLEQSIRFYEQIAELKIMRRFQAGPAELAFLANCEGETQVELVCIPQGQTFEGKGMFVCFEAALAALEEKHALAVARGLNPSQIQEPGDGSRYFYVYDPDGVSVQLRAFPE